MPPLRISRHSILSDGRSTAEDLEGNGVDQLGVVRGVEGLDDFEGLGGVVMGEDEIVHYLKRSEGSSDIFGNRVRLMMVVRDVLDVVGEDLGVEREGLWLIVLGLYLEGYLLHLHGSLK